MQYLPVDRHWLIQGFGPDAKTFCLFTPLTPIEPLRPVQAAALKLGESVNVDGLVAPVRDLFQCVVRQSEGGSQGASAVGEVSFGFFAEAGQVQILTRWNSTDITFLRGHMLSDETLKALRSKN